jgi:hypothetical protein
LRLINGKALNSLSLYFCKISENDPFLSFDNWLKFLQEDEPEEKVSLIRKHARTGRPPGNEGFILRLEEITG